jgi:tRNA threonylcarbamoyladenosine biosynthesis protein TsaB
MRVLALDTTTRAGSVALVEDDHIVAEREGDGARSHAERLPGDLVALLKDAGVGIAAIDLFAVAAGPGSFTGLRIGIATLQGLAFVGARRMVALSALEALGQMGARDLPPDSVVAAWMDAHRHEVFSAAYRVADAPPFAVERLEEIGAAVVGDPAAILSRWKEQGVPALVIGDGALAYRDQLDAVARVSPPPLLAGAIGRMAIARARGGLTIDPAAVQPLYVRRPDAEIERERQSGGHRRVTA